MDQAAQRASLGLDRAQALAPGHGQVNLFAFADRKTMGVGVEALHKFDKRFSAFGRAWAAREEKVNTWGAVAGLRMSW